MTKSCFHYIATLTCPDNYVPSEYVLTSKHLLGFAQKYTRKTVFQLEQGEEAKKYHLQCFFAFRKRMTQKQALGIVQGFMGPSYLVHIKPRAGTMQEAIAYAQKEETRVEDTESFLHPSPSGLLHEYKGEDIVDIPNTHGGPYSWQKDYLEFLFGDKPKEYRMVYVLTDSMRGCTGKSSLIKYILYNKKRICYLPVCDTPSQTTSAILSYIEQNTDQPPSMVIFDIPRSAPLADIAKVFYLAEMVRSGVIVSCFYGKYKRAMFTPPEVLITTNHKFYKQDLNKWAPTNRFIIENIVPNTGDVSAASHRLELVTDAPYRVTPQ